MNKNHDRRTGRFTSAKSSESRAAKQLVRTLMQQTGGSRRDTLERLRDAYEGPESYAGRRAPRNPLPATQDVIHRATKMTKRLINQHRIKLGWGPVR